MPLLRFLKPLIAAALALGTVSAFPAAGFEAIATYGISLGGTHVASVDIRLNDTGKHYAMALDARISGIASIVATGTAKVKSAGHSTANGLVSEQFDLLTRAQGEDFTVKIEYARKDVTAFIVTPPIVNNIDRVALERKHLRGVNDMLAAFVLKGGKLDRNLCNRKLQIFTGVERFNIAMSYARDEIATSKRTGYQGPLVLCSLRYTPISGHYTTSEMTSYLAHSDRILVWFAPLETPGTFIPYRALLATNAGDLSIVLTGLAQ